MNDQEELVSAKPQSGLLTIAAELRLKTYSYVFSGSRISFRPARRTDKTRSTKKAQYDGFVVTHHWQLLLTCKTIYYEGRAMYCKATQFTYPGGCPGSYASKLSNFSRENLELLRGGGRVLDIVGVKEYVGLFPQLKVWYMQDAMWDDNTPTLAARAAGLKDGQSVVDELFNFDEAELYAKFCDDLGNLGNDEKLRKIKLVVKIGIDGIDREYQESLLNNVPWPHERPVWRQYVGAKNSHDSWQSLMRSRESSTLTSNDERRFSWPTIRRMLGSISCLLCRENCFVLCWQFGTVGLLGGFGAGRFIQAK